MANWFINARVRLWKPMVEEMYKEEFGDSEMNCNLSSENNTVKGKRDDVQESDNINNNNNKWEESQDNLVTVDSVQVQPQAEMDRVVNVENVVMNSGTGKLQGDQNQQRLGLNNNNNSSSNFYSY